MWLTRAARFNVGLGGSHMLGFSVPRMGSDYVLTESIAEAVPDVYGKLQFLERYGYGAVVGNLDLALRFFMATYDRWPASADSRVLDAITAIESVLGSGTEIAFEMSFRIARILADDDAQRIAIFDQMETYYDLRSRLVHGETLQAKHRGLLRDVEPLRDLARRLIRGLIELAVAPGHSYDRGFFQQRLDASLQEEAARSALRRVMGLTRSTTKAKEAGFVAPYRHLAR
jgi:hypothetical protein